MRVLVSGSTGLLGTALIAALEKDGHAIAGLVRPETARSVTSGAAEQNIRWD
jgi:uncharacterized protein YbjT (DUF2867 family)